ncbi:MAG: hypothetical protein Q9174_000711 [Haloplaca sp. 1 TL-2023]
MKATITEVFAIALLIATVLAAPTRPKGTSFTVQRRQLSATGPRSGPAALGKAMRKYGWEVPKGISRVKSQQPNVHATEDEDEGRVTATPEEGDASFLSPIRIGGQPMMMNFDTGSSDLWVFSTSLGSEDIQGQSLYDPKKSETFKPLQGSTWKITYGDKSGASGIVGTDVVDIGGAEVQEQAIELATDVTESFVEDADSDGLVGLGFGSINTVKPRQQKTFFENVQDSLENPLFTANLRHATVGSYQFGRIDESMFEGDLSYTPIDKSQGFWQIDSKSFAIGDGPKQTNPNASPAIMDTGTSLILADDDVVRAYWSQVEGAEMDADGGVTFPCAVQLPDFHIALGPTYMATVPGELMNWQRVGRQICYGGMQSNRGQGLQIYGDVLFKAQYVVFDGTPGKEAIGAAPHK